VSRRYDRDSVEFARTLAFSDGLFAIAMTLLVVSIAVPTISDTNSVGELADALNDLVPNFVSFFVSFAVIGRYWLAHHLSISLLEAMDQGFIGLNLTYLAFIAFLPFPTALLGEYFENPLSVVIYAANVGIVSGMEVVLFRHAGRACSDGSPLPTSTALAWPPLSPRSPSSRSRSPSPSSRSRWRSRSGSWGCPSALR
jgi:uncharacterized membrane protein